MLMNMKELLDVANENNFAVPAFNISDYNMFNGIMEASEEMCIRDRGRELFCYADVYN